MASQATKPLGDQCTKIGASCNSHEHRVRLMSPVHGHPVTLSLRATSAVSTCRPLRADCYTLTPLPLLARVPVLAIERPGPRPSLRSRHCRGVSCALSRHHCAVRRRARGLASGSPCAQRAALLREVSTMLVRAEVGYLRPCIASWSTGLDQRLATWKACDRVRRPADSTGTFQGTPFRVSSRAA